MKTLLSAILGLGLISGVAFAEDKGAATTPPATEATTPAPTPGAEHNKEAKKTKKTKKGHEKSEKGATTEAH